MCASVCWCVGLCPGSRCWSTQGEKNWHSLPYALHPSIHPAIHPEHIWVKRLRNTIILVLQSFLEHCYCILYSMLLHCNYIQCMKMHNTSVVLPAAPKLILDVDAVILCIWSESLRSKVFRCIELLPTHPPAQMQSGLTCQSWHRMTDTVFGEKKFLTWPMSHDGAGIYELYWGQPPGYDWDVLRSCLVVHPDAYAAPGLNSVQSRYSGFNACRRICSGRNTDAHSKKDVRLWASHTTTAADLTD